MLRGRKKDSDILLNCSCVDIKFAAKAKEIKELNDQKKPCRTLLGRSSLFPLLRSASFSQSVFQLQAGRCLSHESVRSVRAAFLTHLRIALSSFSFCGLFTIAFHVRGRGIGQGERTDSSSLLRVRHKLPYFQSSARSTKLACCQSRTRSQLLHHNP